MLCCCGKRKARRLGLVGSYETLKVACLDGGDGGRSDGSCNRVALVGDNGYKGRRLKKGRR